MDKKRINKNLSINLIIDIGLKKNRLGKTIKHMNVLGAE
jgi:hypothetical protein